jgi:hypothetical protein
MHRHKFTEPLLGLLLPCCVLRSGIIQEQTMQVGFAIARYPSNTYLDAAALEAVTDEQQRRRMEAGNTRLNAALGALGTTNLLLHIVGDKVLRLSTLNLETLQPETPPGSFWEVRSVMLGVAGHRVLCLHATSSGNGGGQ